MNGSADAWHPPDPDAATVAALADGSMESINPDAPSPTLLICEHAGFKIPAPWGRLGLPDAAFDTHYAGDIGADRLARAIAEEHGMPALLGRYSRLFLDYNRRPGDWDCIRPDMGGIPIPGNRGIDEGERRLRETIARASLEAAIENDIGRRSLVISLHTFTPVFGGVDRPWEIGLLWRDDDRLAAALRDAVAARLAGVHLGMNEPYDWRGVEAFTLQRHALPRNLPCLYLEIRNDLLGDEGNVRRFASALGAAFAEVAGGLSRPSLD